MTEEEHTPAEPLEGEQQEEAAPPDQEPAEEPSRAGSFVRRVLRWAVAFGVVFLLGVMVTWIVRVRPQADQILSLERSMGEARSEIQSLEGELEGLRGLEQENEELLQELEVKDQHLDLLVVLVDVTRARLALAQDQPGEAAIALEDTEARLDSLQSGLEGPQADTVEGMQDRLNLVLNEIETDRFAAQRDLEILANNLVELERTLFGEG
ncbi:MAG: hypothetical protein R3191_05475 [Anaerolineales bacterium]|nr:hypothetical protein [Anaerolineales bacterium]